MLPEALHALRYGVALSEQRHVRVTRVTGEGAFDLLDAVSSRPLFLRDGQALHGLLLDEDAHPRNDLYIALDDQDYVLLSEGRPLEGWLRAHAPREAPPAEIHAQDDEQAVLSLNGPYAWELLSRLTSPDVLGIPYLGFFALRDWDGLCLRAGKTGEYGYDLVVPRVRAAALRARLESLGADMGLVEADLPALDLCAAENGFFSLRTPGVGSLTPLELQLQWRVDYRRDFPGRDALLRRRADAPPRLTRALGPAYAPLPAPGTPVALDGQTIGWVLEALASPVLRCPIAQLLLERRWAHPGLDLDCAGLPWRTVSAPLLKNRSLFVDTQRHSWASRALDSFPPVAS